MKRYPIIAIATFLFMGCGNDSVEVTPNVPDPPVEKEKIAIKLSLDINDTRATDNAYEVNDAVGLYISNYVEGKSVALKSSGNHADNVKFVYDGTWKSDENLYWVDETTHADFYCYYPFDAKLNDVKDYSFSVQTDQRELQSYKKSDLMWGKKLNVAPTPDPIKINTQHAMSCLVITLEPGNGYTKETLASVEKKLLINNLQCDSKVDFTGWNIEASGDTKDITPYYSDGKYRALVVPQTLENKQLISLTIDGYSYTLNQTIHFESNRQYRCTLKVNKTSEGINIGISPWDTDDIDYGGTLN